MSLSFLKGNLSRLVVTVAVGAIVLFLITWMLSEFDVEMNLGVKFFTALTILLAIKLVATVVKPKNRFLISKNQWLVFALAVTIPIIGYGALMAGVHPIIVAVVSIAASIAVIVLFTWSR